MNSTTCCKPTLGALTGLLLAACSGGDLTALNTELDEGAAPDSVGMLEQAIYGGTRVSSAQNGTSPFTSVVHLITADGELCTALKISGTSTTSRFLTAAHCMTGTFGGDTVDISSILNPGLNPFPVAVNDVFIHPSYAGDTKAATISSEFSYDIALLDTAGTTFPVGPQPLADVIFDGAIGQTGPEGGGSGLFVGYGCDPNTTDVIEPKQLAHFDAVSAATWNDPQYDAVAIYAHEVLSKETGAGREGTCSGDSGGPLFKYTSTDGYKVVGVSSTGVNNTAGAATVRSGFSRVANVSRWLAAPHKLSLTNPSYFGQTLFVQSRSNLCAALPSSSAGSRPKLFQCEGFSLNVHSHFWTLERIGTTQFFRLRTQVQGVNRCMQLNSTNLQVSIQNCGTADSQQWRTATVGTNGLYYRIESKLLAGNYLTAASSVDSGQLNVTTGSTQSQHWMLYR